MNNFNQCLSFCTYFIPYAFALKQCYLSFVHLICDALNLGSVNSIMKVAVVVFGVVLTSCIPRDQLYFSMNGFYFWDRPPLNFLGYTLWEFPKICYIMPACKCRNENISILVFASTLKKQKVCFESYRDKFWVCSV